MSKPDEPWTAATAWLRFARSDLAAARSPMSPGLLRETLCFHAQQAVEKSLKAVLLHRGRHPPRTHDLTVLMDLTADSGVEVPAHLREADRLTEYATQSRYPGDYEEISTEEYERSLQLAAEVYVWAERVVGDQ